MTGLALLLVLVAAVLHATWNFCAKQAGGGLPFVYLVALLINAGYVPVVLVYLALQDVSLSGIAVAWILGSGFLKTAYSLFLQRGYRAGDFSLVYPLARGTGPLFSTLGAVVILGERPSLLAAAGGLAIVGSIFWLTGGFTVLRALSVPGAVPLATAAGPAPAGPTRWSASVGYGLTSGLFIAAYTLWDRHGVAVLAIAPILYDAGTALTQLIILTPAALRRRAEIRHHWQHHRRYAFGVAALSPIAYVLVLTAMQFTPVSYVAPAREVSIVFGAFLGAKVLKEAHPRRRLGAAVVISAGVVALALG